MVVAFNIISIKLWGVAMARGVGRKREPRKRGKEKKSRQRKREKPPDTVRSGCVCTR